MKFVLENLPDHCDDASIVIEGAYQEEVTLTDNRSGSLIDLWDLVELEHRYWIIDWFRTGFDFETHESLIMLRDFYGITGDIDYHDTYGPVSNAPTYCSRSVRKKVWVIDLESMDDLIRLHDQLQIPIELYDSSCQEIPHAMMLRHCVLPDEI
jgi:hypothetical protein